MMEWVQRLRGEGYGVESRDDTYAVTRNNKTISTGYSDVWAAWQGAEFDRLDRIGQAEAPAGKVEG